MLEEDERPLPAPAAAPLDELERRMASFETATKRLSRSVEGFEVPGTSSPPRPATRREPAPAPLGESISGLRPAIVTPQQGPSTGALTARRHAPAQGTPGFTSAFGKPAIPAAQPGLTAPVTARTTRTIKRKPRFHRRWLAIAAAAALVVGAAALPHMFPVLADAAVWAEERTVLASASGTIDAMPLRVGDAVTSGQPLARIDGTDQPCPVDGTIARLFTSTGARIAQNEPLAVVALPATRRIVVALPAGMSATVGDRARIDLLGEGRSVEGAVEAVLAAGDPGPWSGTGTAPRRAVLLPAPSPLPLRLGQGARVVLMGAPTAGRQLLGSLRLVLPW